MSHDDPTTRDGTGSLWQRLDGPQFGRLFYAAVCVICGSLMLADLFYDKHVQFAWEKLIGFHGIYGFVGSVLLVLAAKPLRRVLMRDEDYYDRSDT